MRRDKGLVLRPRLRAHQKKNQARVAGKTKAPEDRLLQGLLVISGCAGKGTSPPEG